MSVTPQELRAGGQGRAAARPTTTSITEWSGLNLKETRLSIEDGELAWLENGMLLGKHPVAVPLYSGPAGAALNASSVVKESYGCDLTYGSYTTPHPVAIVVFEDGSAWMRDFNLDQPVDTQIAPAGTFGASPNGTSIKIWQDGPVLFQDDAAGYLSWNGTKLSTIDSGKKGHQLAVFEGRVWLLTAPRTITYTAPNTFNDFVAADGSGTFKITDDAFQGAIEALVSTVEQLWIFAANAIDALGNVSTTAGVTTFSVTNALISLGTTFPDSVFGYFRSLAFFTGYSVHSLLGVVPQKLSGVIDRLFPQLGSVLTFGPRAGIQQLNGVPVLCFLVQLTDGQTGAVRSELLCFQEGKWFFARTPDLGGNRIADMVTLTIHNQPELYGIDQGGFLYRLFARPTDAQQGMMTLSTKLWSIGEPTRGHQGIRVGVDMSAPKATGMVPITMTFVTEGQSVSQTVYENFLALADAPLGLRYALLRRDCPINGQRVGLTIQIPCRFGVTIDAIHLAHAPTDDFDPNDPAPVVWDVTDSNGVIFQFTDSNGAVFDWLGSLTG